LTKKKHNGRTGGRRESARGVQDSLREAVFHPEFVEDLMWWVQQDRRTASRILELMSETTREPFSGKGKPEPLKFVLSGCWSRRINQEHRLVYRIGDTRIDFLQARYHYG
jgi:toxin YoeB